MILNRIFYFFGGLFGAAGIAAFAASSHISQSKYGVIAPILFGNGIVLVSLAFSHKNTILNFISGILIMIGVVLFVTGVIIGKYYSPHLFSHIAPCGGIMMILGWLFFSFIALLPMSLKKE